MPVFDARFPDGGIVRSSIVGNENVGFWAGADYLGTGRRIPDISGNRLDIYVEGSPQIHRRIFEAIAIAAIDNKMDTFDR